MAGVVFVLKFLELFLVFPDDDLGFGKDAGLEVGVDDASLTFGGSSAVGLGSVLTGGGDLLLSAHKRTLLAGLETFVRKVKGSPEGTALLTTTVAGELCPDGAKAVSY